MADSEDEESGSPPSHTSVDLLALTAGSGGSSGQNTYPIPISDQEVSAADRSPGTEPYVVHHEGESLHDQINTQTAETGDRADDGQAYESSGFGSRDKGKAPARDFDHSSNDTQLNNVETSHASSSLGCHVATPPGITEDLRGLGSPVTSGTDPVDRPPPSESKEPNTESRGEDHRTASQDPPLLTSRQKQKQKAEPEEDAGPGPEPGRPAPTSTGPNIGEAAEPLAFRPLRPGEPGWEKSSDRPPKKLPIRLKDAVGRQFVFPWEKAKTWEGVERLIRSSFMHVDVIGPYVMDGRYDLMTLIPFEDPDAVPQAPPAQSANTSTTPAQEASSATPATATPSTSTASAEGGAAPASDPPAAAAAGTSSSTQATTPAPPPAAPSPPPPAPAPAQQQVRVVILPEIWEDIVEPGMSITMHMWPIVARDWPLDYQPPPPPPPLHAPPGAPPPPLPGGWRGRGQGRGRGRGRGGGLGRGVPPMHHGHPPPPRVPVWMQVEPPKPRGKTRKRPEGP